MDNADDKGYPFPAFIVDSVKSLCLVSANPPWVALTGARALADCAGEDSLRRLESWIYSTDNEVVHRLEMSEVTLYLVKTPLPSSSYFVSSIPYDKVDLAAANASTVGTAESTLHFPDSATLGGGKDHDGTSLSEGETDCAVLLDKTDWSETPLGPRSTWSMEIGTVISLMMRSTTSDAFWIGDDLHMI